MSINTKEFLVDLSILLTFLLIAVCIFLAVTWSIAQLIVAILSMMGVL